MAAIGDFDWKGAADGIEAEMRPWYVKLLKAAAVEAVSEHDLPLVGIDWSVSNPHIKSVIDLLAKRIRGVPDTVRTNVQRVIDQGTEQGLSIGDMARMIREYGATDSVSRSRLIARTESATAYNLGAVVAFKEAGVEKVTVLDGDGDEDCASVDGTVQTLKWAEENPIAHPGCVRAFAPVIE